MESDRPVERQKRIREVFEILIEKAPREWPVQLDELCRDDTGLRSEVELLLQRATGSDFVLETLRQQVIEPSLRCLGEDPSLLQVWLGLNLVNTGDNAEELVGRTISHFEILQFLKDGGMGRVYLARDLNLGRTVVLKFLPPFLKADSEIKERFNLQAKTASSLEHPNIAIIHEIDETDDNHLFIAMSHYAGQTLKEKITAGRLPLELALDYAIQLTRALVKAHQNDIIHKDIKPGNVIIGDDGQLRLIDFGLAELAGTAGVTRCRRLSGTAAYMSPEQVRGEAVDHRTDIWSLGVVLFEMLTARRPFRDGSILQVFQSIQNEDPLDGPHLGEQAGLIPEPLLPVLRTCLAKEPEDRYSSTSLLLENLERARAKLLRKGIFDRVLEKPSQVIGTVIASAIVGLGTITIFHYLGEGPAESGAAFGGMFTRITEGGLVEEPGGFGALSWGDFDEDGWVDLVVCGLTTRLYRNLGRGAFEQVRTGILVDHMLSESASPFGAFWADFENDGDLDLYITDLKDGYVPDNQDYTDDTRDQLFLNAGNGSFTKLEADWLLAGPVISATWGDIDGDGWVDLFVTRFDDRDIIFHHQPDGSMEPLSIGEPGKSFGSTFSDVDLDGDLDLIVANRPNMIFRNDGNFEFTELTPDHVPGAPVSNTWSFAVASADYDNDGDFDLAVTDHAFDRIFRNDRENGWTLLEIGPSSYGSCAWGDFDNDGWLDLLVSQGKRLYHNQGNGTFAMITGHSEREGADENISCALADYDNDGDLDIVFGDGIRWGATLTDPPRTLAVYRNNGTENNWLVLTLEGTRSNRSAIGAKVYLSANIRGEAVQQMREVSGGSGHSCQNDLRVHFGLGDADTIERIRIEWPSGQVDQLTNVSPNQFLTLKETTSSI